MTHRFRFWFLSAFAALVTFIAPAHASEQAAAAAFESAKSKDVELRHFLTQFPKGGDIHSHLTGAIYAESWLDWAAEDGLCIETDSMAIRPPATPDCSEAGRLPASAVREDNLLRRKFINTLSLRSFVPYAGHSGHNQFFDTFERMFAKPTRGGDMLAAVSDRAAGQNILYLELMHTLEVPTTFGVAVDLTGDPKRDYELVMGQPFGQQVAQAVIRAKQAIDTTLEKRNALQNCGKADARPGCDVEIRFLHQVIRDQRPSSVYAQIIFGWELMKEDKRFVGLNLVAPEDRYVSLRDYSQHMRQIDYLYKTKGARNVTLHAGELTLGLVRPKNLRFHIREAIELGHAKRIGHGIAIAYEDNSTQLLERMAKDKILVEINLTSNETILGIKGTAHPILLYEKAGVPITLSTDDEGVSRIDLTHEYMRAVKSYDFNYADMKRLSRNSLEYAFIEAPRKQALLNELEKRFQAFEKSF